MVMKYKCISLEQLKNDIISLKDHQLGDYFDNELSMASYRAENGYSIIISFFNHLKDEYNECVSTNNGKETDYHSTLLKTFNWFLPFLNPYHKIIAQANICILTDDEQDHEIHEKYFRDSLKEANKLIKIARKQVSMDTDMSEYEKKALCCALDSIGYLNVREHNYEHAILCLHMCLNLLSALNIATFELYGLYINNIVRLANCYEYTDRPWCAINCVLGLGNLTSDENAKGAQDQQESWKKLIESNADKIRSKIIAYYCLPERELKSKDKTIDIVMEICGLIIEEPNKNYSILKWTSNPESYFDTLKYYIHVLAHCISEYAAKIRVENYSHPFCSTLQIISRFLLDWLVNSCQEDALVTCQANIRAENDACPEALKLLLNRHAILEAKDLAEKCTIEVQNELQEIEFFLFYFAEQELRYNFTNQELKNIFEQYSSKFFLSASNKAQNGDYDSLFHFYVIKFKYLFKQKVDQFMHISDASKLDMAEIDQVFLEMCRCKRLCSEQIFKGLIDECQRLEELFALFQQLQWLNSKTVSRSKLNLFKQLWVLYDYDKDNKSFNIKRAVSIIYEEIIKRNKILILAPIKNAPSCSSEYKNIRCLLELPTSSDDISRVSGNEFVVSVTRIKRNRSQTVHQYFLNPNKEYSKLKWAIFYPDDNPFVYLYMQGDNAIGPQSRTGYEVVPVYLDKEHEVFKDILKRIDDGISDELDSFIYNNSICPRQRCENNSLCNTLLLKPGHECNLKNLINELLTFLEFDFYAARQVGGLDREYLLINYPKKGSFGVLAFDGQLPAIDSGKDFCDICDKCFIEPPQDSFDERESKKRLSPNFCEMFPIDMLIGIRAKVYEKIDRMERFTLPEKELIKAGKEIEEETLESKEQTRLCSLLNRCINGECDKIGEQRCETCRLLKEGHFID